MVAQGKGMAGTVVRGAKSGQALPTWQKAETGHPRMRSSHSGFLIPSPPTPWLQAVPSYPGIWLGEGKLIFCLDQLVFSPPPALANEVPNGLFG